MFNRAKEKEAEAVKNVTISREIVCKFLNFLNSSYWKIPIDTFIEQQTILFDEKDIDKKAVKQVHKEYITMVDVLIEAFCDDLNVSLRELVSSLDAINKTVPIALEEEIALEPVVAAQDYEVFVSMMKRKNLEIQLQTIHFVRLLGGNLSSLIDLNEDIEEEVEKTFYSTSEAEKYILISIMQNSHEEFCKEQQLRTEFERQLEAAIKASLECQYKTIEKEKKMMIENQERVKQMNLKEKDIDNEEKIEKKKTKSVHEAPKRGVSAKGKREPIEEKPPADPKPTAIKPEPKKETIPEIPEEDKYMFRNLLKTPQGIDEVKLKERKEYLKDQRDKLLIKKKKEREEKLNKIEKEIPDRPKTASVAKRAMAGSMKNCPSNKEVLEARKAIYDKLKTEIIH